MTHARDLQEKLAEELAAIALHAITQQGGMHIPRESRCAYEIQQAIESYLRMAA